MTLKFADGSNGTLHYLAKGNRSFPKERITVFSGGPVSDVCALARWPAIAASATNASRASKLNGIVTSWNEAAERMFGYTPDEIIGQSILKLIPADRQDEETEIVGRIRRDAPIARQSHRIVIPPSTTSFTTCKWGHSRTFRMPRR